MKTNRVLSLALMASLVLSTVAPSRARAEFSWKKWAGVAGVAYGVRAVPPALKALNEAEWVFSKVPKSLLVEGGAGLAAALAGAAILFYSRDAGASESDFRDCADYDRDETKVEFLKTRPAQVILEAAATCGNVAKQLGPRFLAHAAAIRQRDLEIGRVGGATYEVIDERAASPKAEASATVTPASAGVGSAPAR